MENNITEINQPPLSVPSLAGTVQRMCAEQERQSERLLTLESRDGENWRTVMKYLLTGIAGALAGFIASWLGG